MAPENERVYNKHCIGFCYVRESYLGHLNQYIYPILNVDQCKLIEILNFSFEVSVV